MVGASSNSGIMAFSRKKIDKQRIDKAFKDFSDKFDENNLSVANQELIDLIEVAQLNDSERKEFLTKIKKSLESKNITLDFLS